MFLKKKHVLNNFIIFYWLQRKKNIPSQEVQNTYKLLQLIYKRLTISGYNEI